MRRRISVRTVIVHFLNDSFDGIAVPHSRPATTYSGRQDSETEVWHRIPVELAKQPFLHDRMAANPTIQPYHPENRDGKAVPYFRPSCPPRLPSVKRVHEGDGNAVPHLPLTAILPGIFILFRDAVGRYPDRTATNAAPHSVC